MIFDWYCEKYACKMSRSSCDSRRRLAGINRTNRNPIYRDMDESGCKTCTQTMGGVTTLQTKRCKTCGEDKPLEDMVKNKKSAGGYENFCRACRSIKKKPVLSEIILPADTPEYIDDLITGKIKFAYKNTEAGYDDPDRLPDSKEFILVRPSERSIDAAVSSYITLDFTAYPELLERLETQSKEDFRTPEMQIMYYIQRGVDT